MGPGNLPMTTPDHFFRQSAVVPYRLRDGSVEILMVTSRSKKRWVMPKGVVEPDLDAVASAAKEALEEAGIEGRVSKRPLGSYRYAKWGGTCHVEVFAMRVMTIHDKWEESFRKREWLSPKAAMARCRERDLQRIVKRLARDLES
jgi:8-oxo-dGTP pyrophosphatase MutT (NUDIX family)